MKKDKSVNYVFYKSTMINKIHDFLPGVQILFLLFQFFCSHEQLAGQRLRSTDDRICSAQEALSYGLDCSMIQWF
jgi:hypothetical protein